MLVYSYDKNTKEYLGQSVPQKNPKKDGEYLIPANATTIVPPNPKKGFAIIFDNDKWIYRNDNRGKQGVNIDTKQLFVINALAPLDKNCMLYSDYINTDEYKVQQEQNLKENKKISIISQINDIDMKRIRAICEPESKTDSGQSWLEYYNAQITELRKQLKEL